MPPKGLKTATLSVALCLSLGLSAPAVMLPDSSGVKAFGSRFATVGAPAHGLVQHRAGKIALAVANNGTFGVYNHPGASQDWFTGDEIPYSCQYPRRSGVEYLFAGAFWIGAVVGRDTLVSVGADGWQVVREMYPDEAPFGEMVYRSISDPDKPEYEGAISEEDYIAVYTDTYRAGIPNDFFGRVHTPLNIEVMQASYAWSYEYAEDFVLFDYQIKNIGTRKLEEVYMGIYVDGMVCFDCLSTYQFTDDHCGFLHTYPVTWGECEYIDTIFAAWIADSDGDFDLVYNDGQIHQCPHVTGTRIIRTPAEDLDVSFNWWIGNGNPSFDFGPREKSGVGRKAERFRDYGTGGLGTPEGDVNKYYVLGNREFDYNQTYTASIREDDTLWLYPNQDLAADFADGFDTRYLLSFGPFKIDPGETLPISFAYVAGANLHHSPDNVSNLPDHPDLYNANLDFTDFAANANWASWVYDNPGVDTDGDGDFGDWRECCTDSAVDRIDTLTEDPLETDTTWIYTVCDTFYYEGDGVPDFRGAAPPPAPVFWLAASPGTLRIRFNGQRSETTRDIFSREIDFEGYRAYIGRDDREESFSLVASYDLEDYNKFVWNSGRRPDPDYELTETPFTIDELRCLYGDSCGDPNFDPLAYTRRSPYVHPLFADSVFYFEAQDFNASVLGVTTPIEKIYPDQAWPSSLDPDSARPDELTEDGYLRYFEYELTIDNLLPTVPYWVNVTAFDYGSPKSGLASLETAVTSGAREAYPNSTWDEVDRKQLKVYIYPNPYILEAAYRDDGFEGRMNIERPPDRTRVINFANLPPRCTIRIFTLDGDLVREIDHDADPTEPVATHGEWDLITRNTQLVVSGIYYWTVEDDRGDVQMGKLVIIM